jgi:hypothetical protein
MNDLRPFLDSAPLLSQPEELRRRMRRDGYLFLRGLLPRDAVLSLRRRVLDICGRHGWLAPGADPLEGRAGRAPTQEGKADYWPVYREVQLSEEFHMLAHHAALLAPLAQLLDEEVFVHPMKIARISFPQNTAATTPPHQDYVHIQGSFETYTSWIPLGDVPRELGGLAVLAGSHKLGVLRPRAASGAGGLGLDDELFGLPWHAGDFQAGDVLLFPSQLVHKALPNMTGDMLRLSVDYRFTGVSHGVGERNIRLHYSWEIPDLTFETLYRDWTHDELKYYWKKLPLRIVPFSEAWHDSAYGQAKKA